jgi:hypothetical protein
MSPGEGSKPSNAALMRYCCIATAILAVILGARCVRLNHAAATDLSLVVDSLYDDAYYYLAVGANLADTGRSTLDGGTLTNGYQPLWLWVLAALAKLVGSSTLRFFVATHGLIATIICLGPMTAWLWRKSPSARIAFVASLALAALALQYEVMFLRGMEPVLMVLLFVPFVVLLEAPRSPRGLLMQSAVLSLFFLVRLDALSLFFAVAVVTIVWRDPSRDPLGQISTTASLYLLATFVVPTVAIYLFLNTLVFHSAVPVSGLVKSLDGPRLTNWGTLLSGLADYTWLSLMAIWLALEALAWRRNIRTSAFLQTMGVLAIALIGNRFYYAMFSTWPSWPWYLYPLALLAIAAGARIIHLCLALIDLGSTRFIAHALLIGVLALEMVLVLPRTSFAQFSNALKTHAPLHAGGKEDLSANQFSLDMLRHFFFAQAPMQVAMGDRAGGLAYWGRKQLSVVQAEGLLLDADYVTAREDGTGAQYFLSHFAIQYWLVDREFIPLVARNDGTKEYVVVEPIQGRTAVYDLPAFCFPESALLYRQTYGEASIPSTRFVFLFRAQQPCSPQSRAFMDRIRLGEGFRQLSLPSEYVTQTSGGAVPNGRRWREDRDRRLALRIVKAAPPRRP